MGIDVSLLFAPITIETTVLLEAIKDSFEDERPSNLVVLYADHSSGPRSVKRCFKEFTTISLWGDCEDGFSDFASSTSRLIKQELVALTVCDHANIGGWGIFGKGKLQKSYWTDPDDSEVEYSGCGVEAIRTAYGVDLQPSQRDRLHFVESFLQNPTGLCVASSSSLFSSGESLTESLVQRIREDDVPQASFECLLME